MRKRSILILLILVILIGAVAYRYRDLLVPGASVNPYIHAALPPGYKPLLRIDVPKMPPGDFKRIVLPASASPFVLLMTELWNLETKTKVATIQYDIGPASPSALSPDGKHFAFEKDGVVNVIAFATGQVVLKIPYDKNTAQLSFVEFAGPGRLAVAARAFTPPDPKKPHLSGTVALEIWDVAAHKSVRSFRVPEFEQRGAAVSADGKRLAAMSVNHLRLHELESGTIVAQWEPPPNKYKMLLSPTAICYSPDGREVAAFLGMGTENSIMRWDTATGQLLGEHPFPALTGVGHYGPPLQWLPDGSGWLADGHALVHRTPGRVARIVWLLQTQAPFVNFVSFLDQNHLLAPIHEDERTALISVPIPWQEINAAQAAEAGQDAAPLRPRQAVSLQVDVGNLHLGDEQKARRELTKALTERLAADQIPVAAEATTQIYARFKEAPGRTLKVYSMGIFRQEGGAREAQETQMALEIGIQAKDSTQPLWHTYLTRGAGLIVSGQGTTKDLHKDTFEALQLDIRKLPWPYFIPSAKEIARLPIVSAL